MLPEYQDLIIKNFVTLIKNCNVETLREKLIIKEVFTQKEINNIFSTDDQRHNKRVFFFNIQKKKQSAYHHLLEGLRDTGQYPLAEILEPKHIGEPKHGGEPRHTGITPFHLPDYENNENDVTTTLPELMAGLDPSSPVTVDPNRTPLTIEVTHSDEFLDTDSNNGGLEFYRCRSKKRGRVLIINNYDFKGTNHKDRTGAVVDEMHLIELFRQMGGWDIEPHSNKTSEEMSMIIKDFTKYREEKKCDICFVIIMSHGDEVLNETVIFGKDGKYLSTSFIENHFTNERCGLFKGKPKVFLYQVCRGADLDLPVPHTEVSHTETDGSQKGEVKNNKNIRGVEDMLIGYATLQGFKAHRDPDRGTWYIELICQIFMQYAGKYSVDHLLLMVDQRLRRRMSERYTMQTSEQGNKGFKKLYLNPGIYMEAGIMKKF